MAVSEVANTGTARRNDTDEGPRRKEKWMRPRHFHLPALGRQEGAKLLRLLTAFEEKQGRPPTLTEVRTAMRWDDATTKLATTIPKTTAIPDDRARGVRARNGSPVPRDVAPDRTEQQPANSSRRRRAGAIERPEEPLARQAWMQLVDRGQTPTAKAVEAEIVNVSNAAAAQQRRRAAPPDLVEQMNDSTPKEVSGGVSALTARRLHQAERIGLLAILAAQGLSVAEIGRRTGLSPERARQLLINHGLVDLQRQAKDEIRLESTAAAKPKPPPSTPRTSTQKWSDDRLLGCLREVSGGGTEPVSRKTFDAHQAASPTPDVSSWPSSALLCQRFGSWTGACVAAGVALPERGPAGGVPHTRSRWSDQELHHFAERYARWAPRAGKRPTVRGYQDWASRPDVKGPSFATLRTRRVPLAAIIERAHADQSGQLLAQTGN